MHSLFSIIFCLSAISGISQQVVVANVKQNIVYCGVDNPLSALVAGYPCASVVLTTDNGNIKKLACGQFVYTPTEIGNVIIKVWVKQGRKLKKAGEVKYRAREFGPPVSLIGALPGGNVTASYFRSMGGIRSCVYTDGCCQPVTTVSYRLIIERNKNVVCFFDNTGAQYSFKLTTMLQELQPGDIIFISSILCQGLTYRRDEAQPLKFIITE